MSRRGRGCACKAIRWKADSAAEVTLHCSGRQQVLLGQDEMSRMQWQTCCSVAMETQMEMEMGHWVKPDHKEDTTMIHNEA